MPEKRLATIVESYLTPVHRDDPGRGCAIPTLAAEIARENPRTRKAFAAKLEQMIDMLAQAVGAQRETAGPKCALVQALDRLRVFHLNDSKKPCGSRVDRHEHIGKGCLGLEPFRRILNDSRFAHLPMLLETPKLDTPASRRRSDLDPWDRRNLQTLRRLFAVDMVESRSATGAP